MNLCSDAIVSSIGHSCLPLFHQQGHGTTFTDSGLLLACVSLLVFSTFCTAVSSAGQYHQLTIVSSVGVERQIDYQFVSGLCFYFLLYTILFTYRQHRMHVCDSFNGFVEFCAKDRGVNEHLYRVRALSISV